MEGEKNERMRKREGDRMGERLASSLLYTERGWLARLYMYNVLAHAN